MSSLYNSFTTNLFSVVVVVLVVATVPVFQFLKSQEPVTLSQLIVKLRTLCVSDSCGIKEKTRTLHG